MTITSEGALILDRLRAEIADLVLTYLDSADRDAAVARTAAIAQIAGAVTVVGALPQSDGTAWELAEAWETAHRIIQTDHDSPCPCAEHTPGGFTLENLARLVNLLNPDTDLNAALTAIDDEEQYPRPPGSRETVQPV